MFSNFTIAKGSLFFISIQMKISTIAVFVLLFLLFSNSTSTACTRVVYQGKNDLILTARSMDWAEDIKTNLWIFPRGMNRNGEVGSNSFKWKSKYGSVIASGWDIASCDGINEKGLVTNLLWLVESEYPKWDGSQRGMSISIWMQYVLDNFATVSDAVENLSKEEFVVITTTLPSSTERVATLHLAITDVSGDNAIFEYVEGKLMIHHSKSYNVMTNSPIFEKQLALNEYWKEIGGNTMLPGTSRAADRFVRASYYIEAVPKTDNLLNALAGVFGVIRNCSVPYGITTPEKPNLSSTLWRTVADHKNMVYYFESALSPNIFWVELKDIDFSEKAKVKKLTLTNKEVYSGNAVKFFKDTEPFKFLGL